MFLDFTAAIAALGGQQGVFTVANSARPASVYLFNSLLPERNMASYHIDAGSMIVRATMAGMVGMDSPYPPGGLVEVSAFLENSAKFANEVTMSEATLRHLQDAMMRLAGQAAASPEALAREALNFLDKVIIQPHFDLMEWLRGQALVMGAIDWTFNGVHLLINYGVPPANFLTPRAAGDAYDGATSKFWEDLRAGRRALKGSGVRAIVAHPDTIDAIRYNPVNQIVTVGETAETVTFRRWVNNGQGFSADVADTVTLISYGREAEVLNPANPDTTIVLPFMPRGKMLFVGNNASAGYQPGQGSVEDDPNNAMALGYTHLAPTVEGGGRPGRWSDLGTPDGRPWQLRGRGVTNGLPVIQAPWKVAVATTTIGAPPGPG